MSYITWGKVDKFELHGSLEKQVSNGKLEGAIYFEAQDLVISLWIENS